MFVRQCDVSEGEKRAVVLCGSSIATVIVLEESPGPIILFVSIAMYIFFFCNNISWNTMMTCICIMFV